MNKNIFRISLKNIAIILLIAIFFIVDRYLKLLALNQNLQPPVKLIGNFFSFNFTPNYYMAFSLPFSGLVLNSIIIAVIFGLIYLIFYLILNDYKPKSSIILLTIILFGAISNILDRISCGYVIDYFELRYFTVFNLADAMISLGAIFFLLNSIVPLKKL
ncbi:MAG: signal peptidase II [Candidatus Falkowbacteria bacterium]